MTDDPLTVQDLLDRLQDMLESGKITPDSPVHGRTFLHQVQLDDVADFKGAAFLLLSKIDRGGSLKWTRPISRGPVPSGPYGADDQAGAGGPRPAGPSVDVYA